MPKISASSALARFRVLDLSRVRAGPTCVKQFADFGADVIKIESPPGVDPNEGMGGPRHGPDMQNLHRNKRAMTLNLKLPEAREVLGKLVKTADVVVENYRPDVKYRLGIDYDSLAKLNPRIILLDELLQIAADFAGVDFFSELVDQRLLRFHVVGDKA